MDPDKVQELLKKLEDPNLSPQVKETIKAGLERAMSGGFAAAYQDQLRLRARYDLDAFAEYVYGFTQFAHHKEISKVLQDPNEREVVIVMNPGGGKSTQLNQIFLPWWMGNYPNYAAVLLSSSLSQSTKFSSTVRSVITSNARYKEVFPEIKVDALKGESREQIYLERDVENPHPNLFASGMRSSKVLGARAELIIVDDPLTQVQARSDLELRNQKEWFQGTLMTRPHPEIGRVIVILTRWHNNDLASLLMNKLNFKVLHMPALGDHEKGAYVNIMPPLVGKDEERDEGEQADLDAMLENIDSDDPMSALSEDAREDYNARVKSMCTDLKAAGDNVEVAWSDANRRPCVRKFLHENKDRSIWPERFTEKYFLKQKANNGTVQFRLLYQGDPTGLEGDIFRREWFQYWGKVEGPDTVMPEKKKIPPGSTYYISVDPAISQKTSADYFVAVVVARDKEGNYYLVEVVRTKLEAPQQAEMLKKLYQKYPQTVWILIETVQFQQALFQTLVQEGLPCRAYKPKAGKDKEMRARSASAIFEAEKFHLKAGAPWLSDLEDEFTSFPRGAHDDQVDAISSLLEEIGIHGAGRPVTYQIGFG